MKPRTTAILEETLARHPYLAPLRSSIELTVRILMDCFTGGGKLLVCGNGGSAADSEHIVGELMKGFLLPRPIPEEHRNRLIQTLGDSGELLGTSLQGALPAISLVSQTSLLSAITNDTSAEMIYAQQVYGYGRAGDVLIGISTSGHAGNVIKAFQVAAALGLTTIAFTGEEGGKLAPLADTALRVPSTSTPEVQEMHISLYHAICGMAESEYFNE